jgi:multiple sugar transport system permease protein
LGSDHEPLLGPALVFVTTITATRSFQVFETVAVLTEGGPRKSTEELLCIMLRNGFTVRQPTANPPAH